jgi:hypothetical protein
MTNQELYDSVVAHLLSMDKQSIGGYGICKYRHRDGSRCAIGGIMPDEKYNPAFEGLGVRHMIGNGPRALLTRAIHAAIGIDSDDDTQVKLAANLQNCHDTTSFWLVTVDDGEGTIRGLGGLNLQAIEFLRNTAKAYGLSPHLLPEHYGLVYTPPTSTTNQQANV